MYKMSDDFRIYILPLMNAPCEKTPEGYTERANKVRERLFYEKVHVCGTFYCEELAGFYDDKGYPHRFGELDKYVAYDFLGNQRFKAARAKNDWFFKRKRG